MKMHLDELESRVLDAIDVDALVEAVCDLVRIPSLGGEETPAQERMAERLEEAGLEVETWPIDFENLARHPAYSAEIERTQGLGVIGSLGENDGGRSLVLNGHVDVVPTGDPAGWSVAPFAGLHENGRIWGRGAVDMKGGLLAAVFAARAIRDAQVPLRGRLLVASVVGEEDGGAGTLALLERGLEADGAVVMEPTDLAVAPAQAGAANFRLTVPGRAAHGCVREEGVSAIESFLPLHRAILELEQQRNTELRHPLFKRYRLPWPISIGTVAAGDWPSSVPERLVAEGRYGVAIGEEMAAAREEFEAALMEAAAADPWLAEELPDITWWGGQFDPAETDVEDPLVVELISAFADVSGAPPSIEGVPYGSDLRLLVREGGIPTALFGPGNVRGAHRADESLAVADLVTATRVLALLALRFCV